MDKMAGRKRIKDRGIEWKEHYHERSEQLKKRFEKNIGPMSYMRWEGHDYTTNGDYFVIVGPSLTGDGKKMFFAGIKKLPEDPKAKVYAPSGEYFTTIKAAFSYASDKWNIPFPKGSPNYSVNDLAAIEIPRHIKGSNPEMIKEGQIMQPQQDPINQSAKSAIRSFLPKLKQHIASLPQIDQLTDDQIYSHLKGIQEWVSKMVASVESGQKKTTVTPQQAVQQMKNLNQVKIDK